MTDEPLDLTEIAGDVDSLCLDLGHHALLAEVKRLRAQVAETERRAAGRGWYEGYSYATARPAFPPNSPYYRTNPTPEDTP